MNMDTREAINHLAQNSNGMNRLIAMIGAKDFVKGVDFVQFKFKGMPKFNFCRISLTTRDTYAVQIGKTVNYKVVKSVEDSDLFFDELKVFFEFTTGLYLSL